MNERNFVHIVELALPEGGFGPRLNDMEAFHRLRDISSARVPAGSRRNEKTSGFASIIDVDEVRATIRRYARSTRRMIGGRRR
jgi:hypothetical protein